MKLRDIFSILGFRSRPIRYGFTVRTCDLGADGRFDFAKWDHPKVENAGIERAHVSAYRDLIGEGGFCIDIGAHGGDSTVPIAIAAGPTGTVLALEPNPYVFPVLEKNARLNHGKYQIIPLLAAAAEREGEMIFNYSDRGFCNGGNQQDIGRLAHGHPYKLSVFAINLAKELETDYKHLLPNLKFIKTDAEGYDLFVLRSLSGVIGQYRPIVKAEVFGRTSREYRVDMFNFFKELEYRIFIMANEPCSLGRQLGPDDVFIERHYDIIALP